MSRCGAGEALYRAAEAAQGQAGEFAAWDDFCKHAYHCEVCSGRRMAVTQPLPVAAIEKEKTGMDRYKVIAPLGAKVRERRSSEPGVLVLNTLSKNTIVDIEGTITEGGYMWCLSPKHGGWIRSDLLERIAHSAEPSQGQPPDAPAEFRAAFRTRLIALQAQVDALWALVGRE